MTKSSGTSYKAWLLVSIIIMENIELLRFLWWSTVLKLLMDRHLTEECFSTVCRAPVLAAALRAQSSDVNVSMQILEACLGQGSVRGHLPLGLGCGEVQYSGAT